jgi:hypothetical protein
MKKKPKLILSILNSNILSEINKTAYIKGLVKVSVEAGMMYLFENNKLNILVLIDAWFISNGYHYGISKHLANKIRKYGYLNPEKKIVMLGITNWHTINGCDRLKYYTNNEEKYINYNPYEIDTQDQKEDKKPLDPYHTHFLLIDSGNPENEYIRNKELINCEKKISRKRQNIYREDIEAMLVKNYEIPIIR